VAERVWLDAFPREWDGGYQVKKGNNKVDNSMAVRKVEMLDDCDDFFHAAARQSFGAEVRFNQEWTNAIWWLYLNFFFPIGNLYELKAVVVSARMLDTQWLNANTGNIRFQSLNYLVNVTYHSEFQDGFFGCYFSSARLTRASLL
jgi:hypothetical protein